MKRALLLIVLISAALLGGCKGKSTNSNTFITDAFPKEFDLESHVYDAELFAVQPDITLIADSLIVLITRGVKENFGRIYNIRDNMKQVSSFGNIGRGPLEFLNPWLTSSSGNKFIIHDKDNHGVSMMEVVDHGDAVEVSMKERHEISNWKPGDTFKITNIIRVGDKYYVGAAGKSKDAYFALLGDTLNLIKYFGDAPLKDDLNDTEMSVVYPFKLAAGDGLFIYTSYLVRSVVCYKSNGDGFEKAWEDHYAPTHYHMNGENLEYDMGRTIVGCVDASITGKYLYLLVSYDMMDKMADRSTLYKDILVYDHDGNRMARLHLDNSVNKFVVSSDDKTLYGYMRAEDKFVSFDLPTFK